MTLGNAYRWNWVAGIDHRGSCSTNPLSLALLAGIFAAACVILIGAAGALPSFAADGKGDASGSYVFLDVARYIDKSPDDVRLDIRREFGKSVVSIGVDRRLSIVYFVTRNRMYVEMPYLSGKIISVNVKFPASLSDYKEALRAAGYRGPIPPPTRVTPTIIRWEKGVIDGYDEVSLWKSASAQDRIIGIHFIKDKTQYNVWKAAE